MYVVQTNDFQWKFKTLKARTGYTFVRRDFAYMSLLLENHQILLKSQKISLLAARAHFFTFRKKIKNEPYLFWWEIQTDLGFETGQP